MTRRLIAWLVFALALTGAMAGAVQAFWSSTDSSNVAAAAADALPQGATPTASRTDATTVAVSFTRALTTRGNDVTSYSVNRYSSAGATTPNSTFSCSWPSATTLSCAESSVPGGVWYYTVTPAVAGSLWVGSESAKSPGVTTDVDAPTVSVTSISPTPNGGGYNNSSPVTVNLSATDNPAGTGGSGVASITYWVDAGSHITVSASTAAPSVTGDGAHVVSFFATDNVGNAGSTQTQNITIDTVTPSAPSTPDLAAGSDSGVSSTDNLTNVTTPTVTGTAEAGSTVTIFDGATPVGSGTATGGNYSITTSSLSSGARSITATATDAASNTSSASAALSVTIDTTPPALSAPDLTAGSDSGSSSTDNITSDTTPTFTGTAEAGLTVTIFDGATQVGSGTATGGNYTITTSTLSSGALSITAKATDAAGNTSTSSILTVTIDTTAPSAIDVQTTNAGVNGKAEAGDTIVFTYSEPIDPVSILAGWTGASTNVVVRLIDGGCTLVLCSDDSFEIWNATNTARLPLTTSAGVNLNRVDYNGDGIGLGTDPVITFASTMVRSGSTITITLGTVSGSAHTAAGNGTMQWTLSNIAYDPAGNLVGAATKTETGTADKDF